MLGPIKGKIVAAVGLVIVIGTLPAGADSGDCDDGQVPGVARIGSDSATACVDGVGSLTAARTEGGGYVAADGDEGNPDPLDGYVAFSDRGVACSSQGAYDYGADHSCPAEVPPPCTDGLAPTAAWMDAMPSPAEGSITKSDTMVASADGTALFVRSYRPDAFPGRLPTILWITPYLDEGKRLEDLGFAPTAALMIDFFLCRGYAVVIAEPRGAHGSGGCPDFGGAADRADAAAIVDWIAAQDWSDGTVGARGHSIEGTAAYSAAIAGPPALKAIVAASAMNYYDIVFYGGVPFEHRAIYPALFPANNGPRTDGEICPTLESLSLDGTKGPWWQERDLPAHASTIDVPVLHTHGTLGDSPGAVGGGDSTWEFPAFWEALEAAEVPRKAYFGAWSHQWPTIEGWPFYELRWFEHWLKGNDTGMTAEPRLTLVGTDGTHRTAETFPPEDGTTLVLEAGDGLLATDVPMSEVTYRDVPQLPRSILRHADGARLRYTGSVLDTPLRVTGGTVEIVAAIDTPSTHFVARLNHVAPDGAAKNITFGYLDALHRQTLEVAEPVEPGVFQTYEVTLMSPEYVVPAGHRLELVIASSDFCGASLFNPTGDCSWYGVISDPSAATVTVREGETKLRLGIAPS